MTDRTEPTDTRPRFRLSQETIAIVTGVLALAGLNLATVSDLREEARADRAAAETTAEADRAAAEARAEANRAAWQAESRQLRDEARADREAFHREMQALQRQVLDLTSTTARLAAVVDAGQDATQ